LQEEILGSIKEVSGHTYDIIYDLLFTGNRIVAVLIQSPADALYVPSWFNLYVSSWGAKREEQRKLEEAAATRRRKLRNMSPDELIAKDPNNFEIRYENVVSVELKRMFLSSRYCLRFKVNMGGIRVRDFTLQKEQVSGARELLLKILPQKYSEK